MNQPMDHTGETIFLYIFSMCDENINIINVRASYIQNINKKNMKTSLKAGFAQIFSCCPKNLSCPPCAPGPYAYDHG